MCASKPKTLKMYSKLQLLGFFLYKHAEVTANWYKTLKCKLIFSSQDHHIPS